MSLSAPIISSGDTRYVFATGVVRGLWARRMGKPEFARLLDSDINELGKHLADAGFAGAESDIEKALSDSWMETIVLVEKLTESKDIAAVLRMFTDFTNASVAVKSHIFGINAEPLFLHGGNASAEDFRKFTEGDKNVLAIPKEVREAMLLAKGLFAESGIPLILDVALDSYFGTVFVDRLIKSESAFLMEYGKRWADSKNLTAYLRLRIAKIDTERFKRFFIEGGYISRNEFKVFESMEIDGIPSRLLFSVYGKPLADAVSHLVRSETFEVLSNYFSGSLEEFLRQNVYIPYGLDVVMAYAFLKYREIAAIGAIVRMRRANVIRERIIERVRYGEI
jgi:vacuolar-type H+-ATPase subunit C/Vma6